MLTRCVRLQGTSGKFPDRARTNTSDWPFVSPATRSDASEVNATRVPSALRVGDRLSPLGSAPLGVRLIAVVEPSKNQSLTKTSRCAPVSPGVRFVAARFVCDQ